MSQIDTITNLIQDYNQTDIIPEHLDYLMRLRKEISIVAFFLGKSVANLKRDVEQAKAQRKVDYYRIQEKHLAEGLGKSQVYAEKGIASIRLAEARLEGEYQGSKTILNQVNEILSSIQQDIAQLRLEYKAEM